MKKVLYVATVLSHVCQFHLPYLRMFQENGYEVHVAARNNLAEKNGLALKYTDKLVEIPFQRSPKSLRNIIAYKQLKKLLYAEKYDLIICNTPMGGILTRLAAKKVRKQGTKVVYIAHGFHFYQGAPKKNWWIYYPIEKHFAKKCDLLITITDEDYKIASKKFHTDVVRMHGLGVDAQRYRFVEDLQKNAIREEEGLKVRDFVCVCVGELNENKNQRYLISLVPLLKQQIPNFKLLIAGNGNRRGALEQQIKELGVENEVMLIGYQTEIERFVRASDVILSASKREGLPFNVLEAMLAKRPVVVSVNRGHRELVQNGINGFITDNASQFIEDIVLLSRDRELYTQIVERAYLSAQDYTNQFSMHEFKQIMSGVMDINASNG